MNKGVNRESGALGRGDSKCKGPEAGQLIFWQSRKTHG